MIQKTVSGDPYTQVTGVSEEETQKGTGKMSQDITQENFFEIKEDLDLCNERTHLVAQSS